MVSKEWQNVINYYHYQTQVYPVDRNDSNNIKSWSNLWKIEKSESSNKEQSNVIVKVYLQLWKFAQENEEHLKKMIQTYKPDLIITDHLISLPAVESSNIPWICLYSANPIRMYYKHCPPADSGFSVNSDPQLWKEFQNKVDCELRPVKDEYKKWLFEKGIELNSIDFMNDSPYLNIYSFPEELDYTDVAPPLRGWFRMDCLIRKVIDHEHGIPLNFLNQHEFFIYLSLGSLGGANVDLMKKLINILNQTTYKVIVAKGPSHEEYELGPRMWGGPFLNQLKILPLVDLVITHGGNNTVTECLYFAKPMIVIPLFGDQLDTSQRLEDKGLGIRLDPFNFTSNQLLTAIQQQMCNDDLKAKLKHISKKLQNSKRGHDLVFLMEKVSVEKKCPF